MNRDKLRPVLWAIGAAVVCLLALIYWQVRWDKYTIEQVSQVLLQEGLLTSAEMKPVEYPDGVRQYLLQEGVLTLPGHRGMITFYPKRHQLRSAIRYRASALRPNTYSEFTRGNVSVRIQPKLSEHDAQRFRRALDNLR